MKPGFSIVFLLLVLIVGCKALADTTDPAPLQTGYEYPVHEGDAIEDIAKAYRDQGVEVTAKQILAANPSVKITTVFRNGLRFHIPETGIKLFIPAQIKTEEEARTISPRLIEPIEFANFTVADIHGQVGAINLMAQKIKVGTDDPNACQFLSNNETNYIRVETVNEYRAAIKNGFAARTTADMTTEGWFLQVDQVLSFMERAKPSQHSLFSAQDLKYLPVSLLNWTEGIERDVLKKASENGMTLEDFRTSNAKHPIHALKIKDNTMTFSDDGCDYVVDELARGDFDGDGYEDALVLIATYYQGGSGRSYEAYVVSKTDPKQRQLKLSVVKAVLQSTTDSPIKTN